MMFEDVLKQHKKQCEQRIQEMSDYCSNGSCADFNEYKKHTGKIFGVKMSLDILHDIVNRYDENNEEEDKDGTDI
jgi:hypothetical protein